MKNNSTPPLEVDHTCRHSNKYNIYCYACGMKIADEETLDKNCKHKWSAPVVALFTDGKDNEIVHYHLYISCEHCGEVKKIN